MSVMRDRNLNRNQQGLISIMITSMLMIVVGLIVLGFAQVSNRELRETTDTQLSTQAYYAAETGVNDAYNLILAAMNSGHEIDDTYTKTTCNNKSGTPFYATYKSLQDTTGSGVTTGSSIIEASKNISYTCLLVNPNPTSLGKKVSSPSVFKIKPSEPGVKPDTLKLSWTAEDPSATGSCPTAATNQPLSSASGSGTRDCPFGVAKIELVPIPQSTNYSQDELTARTMTFFAYPSTAGAGGSVNYFSNGSDTTPSQSVQSANCSGGTCTISIALGGVTPSPDYYYLRVSPQYKTLNNMTITAIKSGRSLGLTGSQILIDVTGKAQDILRRIQVSVDISNNSSYVKPDAALATNSSICKRFASASGYFQVPSLPIADTSTNNRLCAAAGPFVDPTIPGGTVVNTNGTASISQGSCGGAGQPACAAPRVGGQYHYDVNLTNKSNNPSDQIANCSWDWGDGSVQNFPGTSSYCQYGQAAPTHVYAKLSPEPPYPQACSNLPGGTPYDVKYTVTLKINMNNGTTATDRRYLDLPFCY